MAVTAVKPYDRKEMLRRRAARAKHEFRMYSFQEMAWFGRHPKEWDEECRLSGILITEDDDED